MNMATDKNTKGKATHGSSQARTRQNGLMALESRVLFSAATLVSDIPQPVNDAAAAIEASQLTPVEDSDVETYADSMRPSNEPEVYIKIGDLKGNIDNVMSQGPGSVPTPTPGGGSVMVLNPDSMFPTGKPEGSNPTPHPMPVPELSDSVSKRRLEHGPGLHDSVLDLVGVINPDSMFPADEPEGSNPTPHPMPVPELSDSVSKRRLEHGPGPQDSVLDLVGMINPDSMRPTENVNATSNRLVSVSPASQDFWVAPSLDVAAILADKPDLVLDSVLVVNPDSMRPTENINASSSRPVSVSPASQDFWVAPSWEASAGLHDSVLDSVLVINPDSMRPTANIWTDGTMTN
jgi:hypothetical protein